MQFKVRHLVLITCFNIVKMLDLYLVESVSIKGGSSGHHGRLISASFEDATFAPARRNFPLDCLSTRAVATKTARRPCGKQLTWAPSSDLIC